MDSISAFVQIRHLCGLTRTPESFIIDRLDEVLEEHDEFIFQMLDEGIMYTDVMYLKNAEGQNLLHLAAERRSVRFCQRLVELDSGIEAARTRTPWPDGKYPFHVAVMTRNIETAMYLHQVFPPAQHYPCGESYYAIHCCMFHNSEMLTKLLIAHDRGEIEIPEDMGGKLPLHYAVLRSTVTVTEIVYNAFPMGIYSKCVMNEADLFDPPFPSRILRLTPPELADYWRDENKSTFFRRQLELIQLAKEQTKPDSNGELPLHRAIRDPQVPEGTIKLMAQENPASITAADNNGLTPLSYVLQRHSDECISVQPWAPTLLEHLVRTNTECLYDHDAEGRPLMHQLINRRDYETVVRLLQTSSIWSSACDALTLKDSSGETLLHYACRIQKLEVVRAILYISQHGVSTKDKDGMIPIERLLYDHGWDRDSDLYFQVVYELLRYHPMGLINQDLVDFLSIRR